MSRRVVFLIALVSLVIVGAAAAPWTLTGSGLSTALAKHMKDRYGLELKVGGRSVFAVLPLPQVKFENVTLRLPNDALKAEGGTIRGDLRLMPLLFGRIELADLTLSQARITGSVEEVQSLKWAEFFKKRSEETYARRLIVNTSSIHWTDLSEADVDQVNLVISWSGANDPLYVAGSARWRDETVSVEQASVYPVQLASNQLSPVSLSLVAPSARVNITGEAQLGDDPRMTGESSIHATSVRNFTQWSGVRLPFGSLIQGLSIKGDFSVNRRRLSWPSVAVTLGSDKLDGTMTVRLDTERPLITGTLAAGKLNLSGLFAPFNQTRTPSGGWSEEDIDLLQATGSNLDLRLSASTAKVGSLRFDEMAASVLVRPGWIEASISRADFHNGTLKGRLSLASANDAVEFKSQATFNDVDIAPFLSAVGQPRWITGHAQGQFQLEGTGQSPADVVRQAQGRSSITVKDGELVGVALSDAVRRVEKRPLLASLNWKGGRTPFDQAQMQLVLKDGVGEMTESRLTTPELVTSLQGQVSLVDRTVNMKVDVSPLTTSGTLPPVIGFDVSGGWDNIAIMPDARALIERSGAAKPLFGNDRLLPNGDAAPLATAH